METTNRNPTIEGEAKMKFTKSVDGKRRADLVLKVRIGYNDLLTGVCAMLAHNKLMELMAQYNVETIAHVPRKIEEKKRITRMGVMDFLRQNIRVGNDIDNIADDFEADAGSIDQVLFEHTDVTPGPTTTTEEIEAEARKLMKDLYPELKRSDR